jgi:hypothetical protein
VAPPPPPPRPRRRSNLNRFERGAQEANHLPHQSLWNLKNQRSAHIITTVQAARRPRAANRHLLLPTPSRECALAATTMWVAFTPPCRRHLPLIRRPYICPHISLHPPKLSEKNKKIQTNKPPCKIQPCLTTNMSTCVVLLSQHCDRLVPCAEVQEGGLQCGSGSFMGA